MSCANAHEPEEGFVMPEASPEIYLRWVTWRQRALRGQLSRLRSAGLRDSIRQSHGPIALIWALLSQDVREQAKSARQCGQSGRSSPPSRSGIPGAGCGIRFTPTLGGRPFRMAELEADSRESRPGGGHPPCNPEPPTGVEPPDDRRRTRPPSGCAARNRPPTSSRIVESRADV
jgi:hypothetical protein